MLYIVTSAKKTASLAVIHSLMKLTNYIVWQTVMIMKKLWQTIILVTIGISLINTVKRLKIYSKNHGKT